MTENPGNPPRDDEPVPPAGATPPPAGAYPPPSGYGPPPGAPGPAQPGGASTGVGDAFTWAWAKFTQNAVAIVLGVLAYAAVVVVVTVIAFSVLVGGAVASTDEYGNISNGAGAALTFGYLLTLAILVLLSTFLQAGVIRASLAVADGQRITVGTFFRFERLGPVVLTVLLVGVGTGIGSLLFVVPGLVFAFLAQFALFFVLDRGVSPVDSIKASFRLVTQNFQVVLLLFLGVYAANLVGNALCGIGYLVSAPVGLLATTYVYRRLQQEPVAP